MLIRAESPPLVTGHYNPPEIRQVLGFYYKSLIETGWYRRLSSLRRLDLDGSEEWVGSRPG